MPGDIAIRPFDLDDIGAHVAEDLRGIGTEYDARHVDDAYSGKGALSHEGSADR